MVVLASAGGNSVPVIASRRGHPLGCRATAEVRNEHPRRAQIDPPSAVRHSTDLHQPVRPPQREDPRMGGPEPGQAVFTPDVLVLGQPDRGRTSGRCACSPLPARTVLIRFPTLLPFRGRRRVDRATAVDAGRRGRVHDGGTSGAPRAGRIHRPPPGSRVVCPLLTDRSRHGGDDRHDEGPPVVGGGRSERPDVAAGRPPTEPVRQRWS